MSKNKYRLLATVVGALLGAGIGVALSATGIGAVVGLPLTVSSLAVLGGLVGLGVRVAKEKITAKRPVSMAHEYPSKPNKRIVWIPPGGGSHAKVVTAITPQYNQREATHVSPGDPRGKIYPATSRRVVQTPQSRSQTNAGDITGAPPLNWLSNQCSGERGQQQTDVCVDMHTPTQQDLLTRARSLSCASSNGAN